MAGRTFLKSLLRVFLLVLLIFGFLQLPTPRPYQVATPHMSPVRALLYEITSPAKAYFDECDCTESKPVPPYCKLFPDGSVACVSYACTITNNNSKKCEAIEPAYPPGHLCYGCTRSRNVPCSKPRNTCPGGICP